MTKQQEQLLENKVRKIVKKVMTEAINPDTGVDEGITEKEMKIIGQWTSAMWELPSLYYASNDPKIKQIEDVIRKKRDELIRYVESNSSYKYDKIVHGWKRVK
jgi:hypothetical protein